MTADLSLYDHFVDSVTSEPSKSLDVWIEQLRKLEASGVNPALLTTAGIGLGGEAGEFSEIVKKLNFHGKEFTPELREHMIKELGDIVFYWMMACQAMQISADEVITRNVEKLQARYPGGFSVERSENRAEGDI